MQILKTFTLRLRSKYNYWSYKIRANFQTLRNRHGGGGVFLKADTGDGKKKILYKPKTLRKAFNLSNGN